MCIRDSYTDIQGLVVKGPDGKRRIVPTYRSLVVQRTNRSDSFLFIERREATGILEVPAKYKKDIEFVTRLPLYPDLQIPRPPNEQRRRGQGFLDYWHHPVAYIGADLDYYFDPSFLASNAAAARNIAGAIGLERRQKFLQAIKAIQELPQQDRPTPWLRETIKGKQLDCQFTFLGERGKAANILKNLGIPHFLWQASDPSKPPLSPTFWQASDPSRTPLPPATPRLRPLAIYPTLPTKQPSTGECVVTSTINQSSSVNDPRKLTNDQSSSLKDPKKLTGDQSSPLNDPKQACLHQAKEAGHTSRRTLNFKRRECRRCVACKTFDEEKRAQRLRKPTPSIGAKDLPPPITRSSFQDQTFTRIRVNLKGILGSVGDLKPSKSTTSFISNIVDGATEKLLTGKLILVTSEVAEERIKELPRGIAKLAAVSVKGNQAKILTTLTQPNTGKKKESKESEVALPKNYKGSIPLVTPEKKQNYIKLISLANQSYSKTLPSEEFLKTRSAAEHSGGEIEPSITLEFERNNSNPAVWELKHPTWTFCGKPSIDPRAIEDKLSERTPVTPRPCPRSVTRSLKRETTVDSTSSPKQVEVKKDPSTQISHNRKEFEIEQECLFLAIVSKLI